MMRMMNGRPGSLNFKIGIWWWKRLMVFGILIAAMLSFAQVNKLELHRDQLVEEIEQKIKVVLGNYNTPSFIFQDNLESDKIFELLSIKEKLENMEVMMDTFKKHMSLDIESFPLKIPENNVPTDTHIHHYFMSTLKGRGYVEAGPEFFTFPSPSLSHNRLLCMTLSSQTYKNTYAFAFNISLPPKASFIHGTTLISQSHFDFNNPWHSMYNLLQFLYWRLDNHCSVASNLLLFNHGKYVSRMGPWITNLMNASNLPSSVVQINRLSSSNHVLNIEAPVCFERAIMSRSGIGGMAKPLLKRLFSEARCHARRSCGVDYNDEATLKRLRITLMVRDRTRRLLNLTTWKHLIDEHCQKIPNCSWSLMYISNLTFCEQVRAMSETNILISPHGAQLTNMIFMPPGSRVMEMFPSGWLELGGHGQYIYKRLANWASLHHDGYWRDVMTPPCPNPHDPKACFKYYKDQDIGINVTYVSGWLQQVINRYKSSLLHHDPSFIYTNSSCECP